jgi:hypothetical protein
MSDRGESTMKKSRVLWVVVAIATVAITLASGSAVAQGSETGMSGAGELSFPDGATFDGIQLSGLELGTGASIASNGSATGRLFAVLLGTSTLGQPQQIDVDGKIDSGSMGSNGSATLSGSATVDMGQNSVPIEVPFTATATTESLLLKLGTSLLPSATLTAGSITIE